METTLETIPDLSKAMQAVFEAKEPLRLTPIFATLQNPINLLNALKLVSPLIDYGEVPVYVENDRIRIKTLDLAEVSLVSVVLRPERLNAPYSPVGFKVRMENLIPMFPRKMPKDAKDSDVDIVVNTDTLGIDLKAIGVSFKVPVFELAPDPKELPDPKISFETKITPLNIKDLVNALEQLRNINDNIRLAVEGNKLKVSSKNDMLEKTIEIPCIEIAGREGQASYDTKRLLGFLKAFSKLGGEAHIEFSEDLPLWIHAEYSWSDAPLAYVSYFQAPRLERTD
jgi:hypothetical protein